MGNPARLVYHEKYKFTALSACDASELDRRALRIIFDKEIVSDLSIGRWDNATWIEVFTCEDAPDCLRQSPDAFRGRILKR